MISQTTALMLGAEQVGGQGQRRACNLIEDRRPGRVHELPGEFGYFELRAESRSKRAGAHLRAPAAR